MLSWIKSTKLYVALVALLIFAIGVWGEFRRKAGKQQAETQAREEQRQREDQTRERGRQANEKIKSGGDTFIPDWLHDNNRFRD